mgnify:CR=1 FL=1
MFRTGAPVVLGRSTVADAPVTPVARQRWPLRTRLAPEPLIAPRFLADDARVDDPPTIQGHTGRSPADPSERRDSDRLKTVGVHCNRGKVIDLSTRGIRLRTFRRWKEGQRRILTLSDEHSRVTLEAKCVWVRPAANGTPFQRVVGLCFEHAIPEQERALAKLAETHNGAVGMIKMVGKTITPNKAA